MKQWIIASAIGLVSVGAQADAGYMLGISHNFGGTTGITFKVLSTDQKDKWAFAAGVSYFPWQSRSRLGLDVGAGYTFNNGALTAGYDLLNSQPQVALGYANAKDRTTTTVLEPVPEETPASDLR